MAGSEAGYRAGIGARTKTFKMHETDKRCNNEETWKPIKIKCKVDVERKKTAGNHVKAVSPIRNR
jgi:hypothetical protein